MRKQPLELRRVTIDLIVQLNQSGRLIAPLPDSKRKCVIRDDFLHFQIRIELLDRRAELACRAGAAVEYFARIIKEQALI